MNMPKFHLTFILLAAAYGKLGRAAEARNAVGELLALRPEFSDPEIVRAEMVKRLKSDQLLEDVLDGLRKAGLEVSDRPVPTN